MTREELIAKINEDSDTQHGASSLDIDALIETYRWKPIDKHTPRDRFLMLRGDSGYHSTPYRIMIARYREEYETRDPDGKTNNYCWRTHSNDSVMDDGDMPTEWMDLIP